MLEKDILDSISIIREKSKRPDAESIFKHLSSTGATNIVVGSIRLLIAKSKVVNRKRKQGLDSFFITDCQLEPGKQKTIDKLLDLNWLQSNDQYKVNVDNKTDKKNVEMPQLHNGNPSVNAYDVNKKQSHNSGKPENDKFKIKSNGDSKTKIMVFGDLLVKYL